MESTLVNRSHVIVLSMIWLSIHVFLFFYPGARLELFDSKVYRHAGDFFIQNGTFEKSHQLFYAIPIILIGFFHQLPDGLIYFIVFQCLLSGVATFALYRSASLLFNDSRAGLMAGVLFLLWWDSIQWNTALLTESLFCSIVCFLIYRLILFTDTKSDFLIVAGLVWLCAMTRPTGVIFLASVLTFLLARYNIVQRGGRLVKIIVSGLTIAVPVLAGLAMFSIWDFSDQYVRGNIVTYIDTNEANDFGLRLDNANVIPPDQNDPPLEKMASFVIHNPVHFIMAGALKIFYLLSGYRPYYSIGHNFLSVTWNVMIYILFVVGYTRSSNTPARTFALSVVIITCLLIGISTVDWDNRFFVPMVPALVLFSAGGGLQIAKTLSSRFPQ